ncbi:MAG TPA: hypothetical protein VFA64_10765 [Hyphomicrobiaceae bacterium]|nr:hypothetical protein [Hyphomicrobiaceae bacterium]
MATTAREPGEVRATAPSAPGVVRWSVLGLVGLVFAGALYLIAVRGEALIVDLAAFSRSLFCF